LKNKNKYDIIYQSEKETGENPVRARRREAQKVFFLFVLPQKRRQTIGEI